MNVLIVDDHAVVRLGLKQLVEEAYPYVKVMQAATGAEALSFVITSYSIHYTKLYEERILFLRVKTEHEHGQRGLTCPHFLQDLDTVLIGQRNNFV